MEESYPATVYLLGLRRDPFSQEKLFSSPETRLCIPERHFVRKGNRLESLLKFAFQTWLGAGGVWLELTAQLLSSGPDPLLAVSGHRAG